MLRTMSHRLALVALAASSIAAAPAATVSSATRLLDNWQLEDALAQAEFLLAAQPADADNQTLAGEVLHQRGQHLQALAMLRAAAGTPRADSLLPQVESSAAYSVGFGTLETPHFRIRYLNKDEIVATYAEPVLEAAYQHIGGDLQFLPAERGEKIVVEIYPDAHGLSGATGLTLKEIETTGTIAVCKFHRLMITSPLATADGYAWADTVAHEFTHLIVSKKSHNTIPIWLHEGIAKFFESRWKGPAGQALSAYSEKLLSGAVHSGKYITFEQMHPSMAKLPSQEDAALAFAEVFTVIEYLTQHYGTASIAKVLAASSTGMPLEQVLQQVFNTDLHGLEKAWKKYLAKRSFRDVPGAGPHTIKLAGGEEDSKKEKPLEAMQDKAVHDAARLGELLQLRNQPKAAVVEYEKAMAKGGMRYNTLVNRLARAYVEVQRPVEAMKLLDQCLTTHPDDTDAHLLAGRIRLSRQEWDVARTHFEAVRLQNPFNPEIHVALAELYKHAGDATASAAEQHFYELSRHARPPQSFDVPAAPAGEASLSIASVPWGDVQVDGKALSTPAWDTPVKAGSHIVKFTRPDGSVATQPVNVGPGGHGVTVLR